MADLIDKEDVVSRKWLLECVKEGWIKFDTEKDENRFIHLVRDIAPSAQKTGKWEMRTDPYGFFDTIPVCSVCGCTNKWREKYSYCPMCGARMECEQDE